jgi:hypothetical protein
LHIVNTPDDAQELAATEVEWSKPRRQLDVPARAAIGREQ